MKKYTFTLVLLVGLALAGCAQQTAKEPATINANTTAKTKTTKAQSIMTESGLQIQDIKIGTGQEVAAGDRVSVHYVGTFKDGSKFDSSIDRGTPFSFTVGAGQVIQGWDEGVAGMKIGGKRKLAIPPSLGYGDQDRGTIPGGSTLYFDIELISIP